MKKVNTDPRQYKILREEMTPLECSEVTGIARQRFHLSEHAMEKMESENITLKAIQATINYGLLTEVSSQPGRFILRCLLRMTIMTKEHEQYVCCVVVELHNDYNEVITVYRNDVGDEHTSRIDGFYRWSGSISDKVLEILDQ